MVVQNFEKLSRQGSLENLVNLHPLLNVPQNAENEPSNYEPRKTMNVLLGGVSGKVSKGVSLVMENLMKYSDSNINYSMLNVDLDDNTINFTNSQGEQKKFGNRREFANYANAQGLNFDVLNVHGWHFSDHYKPFQSKPDSMALENFIKELGSPNLVYTDHSNPLGDLEHLRGMGIDYEHMKDEQKEKFLDAFNLNTISHPKNWEKGWTQSDFLGRKQLMKLADKVVHVSNAQLEKQKGIVHKYNEWNKHDVVWNGSDFSEFENSENIDSLASQYRTEWGANDTKFIAYAGRIVEDKGVKELAQAAKQFNDNGEKVKLVFAGNASENMKRDLQNLSGNNIIFLGRIDDRQKLAAFYKAADLVSQPTWGDCFNQVVGESIAMGTPAVVADVLGPSEVYVNNGIAIGHAPKDVQSLYNALEKGLNDKELITNLIEKGKEFFNENLGVDSMANKYNQLFRSLSPQQKQEGVGPKLSVVMPVYVPDNHTKETRLKYLRDAIQSNLNQTINENYNIIISDDCSGVDISKLVHKWFPEDVGTIKDDKGHEMQLNANGKIKILLSSERSYGPARPRNRGYDEAMKYGAEFISHIDSDDIALPTRLEDLYNHLNEHPETTAVHGDFVSIDENGREITEKNPVDNWFKYLRDKLYGIKNGQGPSYVRHDDQIDSRLQNGSGIINNNSTMFRAEVLGKFGREDYNPEHMRKAQDWAFWNRMTDLGTIDFLNKDVVKYRQHSSNLSNGGEYDKQKAA